VRDDKRGEPIFSTILRQGLSLEDPAGFTLDDNLNYRGSPSRKQGPLRETLLMRDDKRGEPIFSKILRQGLSLEDPAGFTLDDNLNYRDRLRESRVLFERPC
jgi:hypothetical protein